MLITIRETLRDLTATKKSRLLLISLIMVIISSITYYSRFWDLFTYPELILNDFKGIYAASSLIASRENPYDYELASKLISCTNCPYQLPPLLASILAPLAGLPPKQIQMIWLLMIQIALIGTIVLSLQLIRQRYDHWIKLFSVALVFAFYPIYVDLNLGNISIFLGFIAVLSFWLWQRDYRRLSGLVLGLGVVLKFIPALLLIYFIIKKEYTVVLYAILSTLVLLVLPDLLMQTNYLETYIQSFSAVLSRWSYGSLSHIDNQSLHGMFARFYVLFNQKDVIPEYVRAFSLLTTCAIGIVLVLLLRLNHDKASVPIVLEYSLILFLFPLGSSNTWSHYYAWVIMIFPSILFMLVTKVMSSKNYFLIILFVGGIVMMSQPYRIPRLLGYDAQVPTQTLGALGVILQSLMIYGAVLIVLVGLWMVIQEYRKYPSNYRNALK